METTVHLTPKTTKLLNTAKKLFVQNGFQRIGVDQIVLESDVTKSTLYKHFGSREGLVIKYTLTEIQKSKDTIQEVLNNSHGLESLKRLYEWHIAQPEYTNTGGTLLSKGSVEPRHIPEVVRALEDYEQWKYELLMDLAADSGRYDETKIKILMNIFNSILAPYNKIYPSWDEIVEVLKIGI